MAAEATSLDKSFGTENEERTLAFVVGSMSTSSDQSSVDHSVSTAADNRSSYKFSGALAELAGNYYS